MSPSISVIINTIRRSTEMVEKSINAALDQKLVNHVILVDQNSIPLSLDSKISENPKLKILKLSVPSVSEARNAAPYPSDSDWLIFCDDDGYLADNYLEHFEACLSNHPKIDLFAGSIKRTDNGEYYSKRHAVGGNLNCFLFTKLLMGSNFAVKRKVFEDLGKFDPYFGAGAKYGSSEETDFAWNAFFSNIKMKFVKELVVYHPPPFSGDLQTEIEKAYRYGQGKGALVSKWLFHRKKIIVVLELVEMLFIPAIRMVIAFLCMNFGSASIQYSSFRGRLNGLARFYS